MFDPSFCHCRTSPKGFLRVHIGIVDQKLENENDRVIILTSICLRERERERERKRPNAIRVLSTASI